MPRNLILAIAALTMALSGCSSGSQLAPSTPVINPTPTPTVPQMAPTFTLTGDISQVHDPSITKIAVGRSTSPQGPFADRSGTPMLQGGGTILLESGTNWTAPGGATVLIDPVHGDLIAYHALKVSENYQTYLFVDALTWPNDWPAITQ